jgi:dienelactone hydrolase
MRQFHLCISLALVGGALVFAPMPVSAQDKAGNQGQPIWRVLEPGKLPADARLGNLRTLRDEYHPWVPPTTKQAWEKEAQAIRERVLVSNGLWPLPPKTPLNPVVHGKIERDGYTIEKVYFESHPGHFVTGNLYRPAKIDGKAPGVLCPHGHWANGRFYDSGEQQAQWQIEQGAEQTLAGARYPVQARMAQLARMGCIVFHYDMVGYADSRQIDHRRGFGDIEAGFRLQNWMGLQTWNSIRALDFLLTLPEVDPQRIGVTGSSGGGTQTFMLCAVDPRPAVAFPAVMVSTGMQGGCVCENADYLRIGINNIALAALFAPKPQAMSGANDWTIAIETKGLPELKQVYSLYDKAHLVHAKAYPQFGHNYNQVAREMMYNWFNEHLNLGAESPVAEESFEPVPPAELSVFDSQHSVPADAQTIEQLRGYLTKVADEQYQALLPKDSQGIAEYRRVVGTAARVLLDAGIPAENELDIDEPELTTDDASGLTILKGLTGRYDSGEKIPYVVLIPEDSVGTVVLWFDGRGKSHLFDNAGRPVSAVQQLLDKGMIVASADVFLTGEFVAEGQDPQYPAVDGNYPGYTFGYNRPVLSNRVRDVLTCVGGVVHDERSADYQIHLVGTGGAGPWVLLARGLVGNRVNQTVVDVQDFRFGQIDKAGDPMYLPGALKYGGLGGLAALSVPGKLVIAGAKSQEELSPLKQVYQAAAAPLSIQTESLSHDDVAAALLR